jgi:hypothetical protein
MLVGWEVFCAWRFWDFLALFLGWGVFSVLLFDLSEEIDGEGIEIMGIF